MAIGKMFPGGIGADDPRFSLAPGSVNTAFDSKYWVAERAPLKYLDGGHFSVFRGIPLRLVENLHPPLIFRTRFVLPIRGAGNDRPT